MLDELTELNRAYREKNGFVFLVCASGLPADAILERLKARLPNDRDAEVRLESSRAREGCVQGLESGACSFATRSDRCPRAGELMVCPGDELVLAGRHLQCLSRASVCRVPASLPAAQFEVTEHECVCLFRCPLASRLWMLPSAVAVYTTHKRQIENAVEEQRKITQLRFSRLLAEIAPPNPPGGAGGVGDKRQGSLASRL